MKQPGQNDRSARFRGAGAFSLVEVVLAIGIFSFALLAVVGLLPVGLQAVKNANEEAAAANVIARISNALRQASSSDGVNYGNQFAGMPIGYAMDGTAVSYEWPDLSMDSYTAVGNVAKSLSARLEILQAPTSNPPGPGCAVVTVAWPAAANPQWDAGAKRWSKAERSITAAIQFRPTP